MIAYDIECTISPFTGFGPRACELMRFFGMNLDGLRRRTLCHRLALTLSDGQICLLTGPSGAGKSVLLNALYAHIPPESRIRIESIPLEADVAFIDALDAPLAEALPVLTRAGLADLPALLCPAAFLSDGQKWRARLACALLSKKQYIFADECCAALDHTAACAVAWNLRRTATRTGRTFILAGCREDMLPDLSPDILVRVAADRLDILHGCPSA